MNILKTLDTQAKIYLHHSRCQQRLKHILIWFSSIWWICPSWNPWCFQALIFQDHRLFFFFPNSFHFLLVTRLFLLLLNTISCLTICLFKLPPIPHSWFQDSLLLSHHVPVAQWLKTWCFMSSKQQISGAHKDHGCTFLCSDSLSHHEWIRFFYVFYTSYTNRILSPKNVLLSVSLPTKLHVRCLT